jgi:hypothetical protein
MRRKCKSGKKHEAMKNILPMTNLYRMTGKGFHSQRHGKNIRMNFLMITNIEFDSKRVRSSFTIKILIGRSIMPKPTAFISHKTFETFHVVVMVKERQNSFLQENSELIENTFL